MRTLMVIVAVAVASVAGPATALAGWSTSSIPVRHVAADTAVDARGDAAVAWASFVAPSTPSALRTVDLVVRLANGRTIRRTVWSSRRAEAIPASVVLGDGEVTVAWLAYTPRKDAAVWAAYGPLVGRWAPARVIGHWRDAELPAIRYPRLAVAPDGEVLLAWDESSSPIDGPAVAWRAPGHGFGVSRPLIGSVKVPLSIPHELGPIPAFDAHGAAYISGPCDGIVFTAPSHRHHFEGPVVVAPPPAAGFTLSLSGAGIGLAAWVHGVCTTTPSGTNMTGPLLASVLRTGAFGKPQALTSTQIQAGRSKAVAFPAGGGTVSWDAYVASSESLAFTTFSVQVDADGALGPLQSGQQIPGGLVPIAIDGGGDEVLAPDASAQGRVVVRPVSGGPNQPAPSPYGGVLATAAPTGRAVALAWSTKLPGGGSALELSVWRP